MDVLARLSAFVKHLSLFAVGLSCLALVSCMPNTAAAQTDPTSLQKVKQLEAKVKQVVQNNMDACVAITNMGSAGSGAIISEDGLIATAGHVMGPGKVYEILLPDGRTAKARPLGKNLNVDVGLVQITDPGPWPFVKLGKSAELKKGDWVVSLGHSGGFELGRKPPVRTGRVLGRNEYQLETDAVLIGGDSGGPLFNLDGELVGIHSSIGDSIAENRHVMTEIFERDFDRMKKGEDWGQLPELAKGNDGSEPPKMGIRVKKDSAAVTEVRKNSPASNVGIKEGDVILKFDGQTLDSGQHLIDLVKTKISGDVVRIVFNRNGRILDREIRLK
jgi:serine protease Do